MIINVIYSFGFSCFYDIVPGLGTDLQKQNPCKQTIYRGFLVVRSA